MGCVCVHACVSVNLILSLHPTHQVRSVQYISPYVCARVHSALVYIDAFAHGVYVSVYSTYRYILYVYMY